MSLAGGRKRAPSKEMRDMEPPGGRPLPGGKGDPHAMSSHMSPASRSGATPSRSPAGDSGDPVRQKMLFTKCLWIMFQQMALAVVVTNGLLNLQNIHQRSTQALQVIQRASID